MLFKFARDVCLFRGKDGSTMYLYGAVDGRDDLAMKAASHELHAAIQYAKDMEEKYSIPLQCMVDFQGFRIVSVTKCSSDNRKIAMPLLPIGRDTIVYGSCGKMIFGLVLSVRFDEDCACSE